MNKSFKDQIHTIISELQRIIKTNDNKIPKYIFSKNFLEDIKNRVDKCTSKNELFEINKYSLNNFAMYVTMSDIDTTCIKKSIFKIIDKYCSFKNYKETMELPDEYTDYEDNNDESEEQIVDGRNNTDDNYFRSEEEEEQIVDERSNTDNNYFSSEEEEEEQIVDERNNTNDNYFSSEEEEEDCDHCKNNF